MTETKVNVTENGRDETKAMLEAIMDALTSIDDRLNEIDEKLSDLNTGFGDGYGIES